MDYKKWTNVLDGKPESLWNLELESKGLWKWRIKSSKWLNCSRYS
nr:hypothetical protein [Mycoplasmopsis bovis]